MNIEGWIKTGKIDPFVVKQQVCKEACHKPLWYINENVASIILLADEKGQELPASSSSVIVQRHSIAIPSG